MSAPTMADRRLGTARTSTVGTIVWVATAH
jgi:hypothetical protein